MPPFNDSGFLAQPPLLSPGAPGYSLGSFDDHQATAKFLINNVAIATDVATITGVLVEGNIPAAGQLISIRGCPLSEFNVTDVALASVTITASSGIGTMTFALTHADVTSVAAAAVGLIQVAEIPEIVPSGSSVAYAGQAFALSSFTGRAAQGRTITWSYSYPTGAVPATSMAIQLEGAIKLSDFTAGLAKVLATGTSATGETQVIQSPTTINFLRINITVSDSATAVGIVGKILV